MNRAFARAGRAGRASGLVLLLLLLARHPWPSLALEADPTVGLSIEIASRAPGRSLPSQVRLVATALDRSGMPLTFDVATSRRSSIALPTGTWTLATQIDGFWCREQTVVVADRTLEVALAVWPTGTVAGAIEASATTGGQPLWAGFEPSSPAANEPKGSIPCRVRGGRWTCELPASTLDVQFNVPGRSTHYEWDVATRPGETRDLGMLQLVPGASVVGWIEGGAGKTPAVRQITVSLRHPDTPAEPDPGQKSRDAAATTTANQRGFFQLVGVRPAEYALRAQAAGVGEAEETVLVQPASETRLPVPLVLAPLATLVVTVEPPLDPAGGRWSLNVDRVGSTELQRVTTGDMDEAGAWKKTGLTRARYWLSLNSRDGKRWASQEVALTEETTDAQFRVVVIEVQGTVQLGGKPLAAKVVFGGNTEESIPFISDQDGEFSGVLPRAGRWVVEVETPAKSFRRTLRGVDMALDDQGRGRVSLRLPSGILHGIVTDAGGQPRSAVVSASPRQGTNPPVQVRAGDDGLFEIHGLDPGPTTLLAKAEGSSSEPLVVSAVSAEQDETRPRVRLVLKPSHVFRGRIVSADGPVWNAQATIRPIPTSGSGPTAATDADGQFEVAVPEGTAAVQAVLSERSHTLRITRVPMPESSAAVPLFLEAAGGTLKVILPKPELADGAFLFHEGAGVAVAHLRNWLYRQGAAVPPLDTREFLVPRMAPGAYLGCIGGIGALQARISEADQRASAGCVSGVLSVGGELTLDLSSLGGS
jgi:hypothetical protein